MAIEKEINLDQLYGLAKIGLTEAQIATSLGISVATLERRKSDNEEFAKTLKAGKAAGVQSVTNALYENAVDKGNASSMIFFLKNRAGWSDKQEVEHSGAMGVDVTLDAAIEALKAAGIDPSKL